MCDMPMNSDISEARQRIASAYDPELLRGAGHRLIDQLAAHFRDVQAGRGVVLPWRDPAANVAEACRRMQSVIAFCSTSRSWWR
jgi:hypothetical protein